MNNWKNNLFIGNIYKVTKLDINYEEKITLKYHGLDALVLGKEEYGYIPESFSYGRSHFELYKENVLLARLDGVDGLISTYAEVHNNGKRLFLNKNSIYYSDPYFLNQLFIDENSLRPYIIKNNSLVKRLVPNNKK